MQGIKIRLTLIISGLLLMSMALLNFVLISFWQQDALDREINLDQAVMERLFQLLPAQLLNSDELSPEMFLFSDFYSNLETGRILIYCRQNIPVSIKPDMFTPLLDKIIEKAAATGSPVTHSSGSLFSFFAFARKPALVNARPIIHQGQVVGVVAIARSLEPLFQTLWRVEKIVLVYILINLIVFSVIGFFRMAKLVARPIDRLVELADQFNQFDDLNRMLFATERPGGEFGRLANSLNSMLARIEQDRKSLETSFKELATVNQKLKKQQQEMIRTEKLASVGRMAAGLAHEIGNPLGVVQGYLGLLGQSSAQSDEHLDYIRRAEQELQRVNALIRQMLDFARVSKGEPTVFSLHDLLRSVIDMVQMQSLFEDINVITTLDANRDMVYGDQDRLRQVILNCLLNSGDALFAAERDGDARITLATDGVESHPDDNQSSLLRLQISDNGIGIAEDQLAVIFDPFYTTKEPGKGTGLGLSVSLSIIESMGGKMEMESNIGQGSVLSVFLPISAGDNV